MFIIMRQEGAKIKSINTPSSSSLTLSTKKAPAVLPDVLAYFFRNTLSRNLPTLDSYCLRPVEILWRQLQIYLI